jgi:hypothetical protein
VRSCVPGRAAVRGTYFYTVIPKMALVACAHCQCSEMSFLLSSPYAGAPLGRPNNARAESVGAHPGAGQGLRQSFEGARQVSFWPAVCCPASVTV